VSDAIEKVAQKITNSDLNLKAKLIKVPRAMPKPTLTLKVLTLSKKYSTGASEVSETLKGGHTTSITALSR